MAKKGLLIAGTAILLVGSGVFMYSRNSVSQPDVTESINAYPATFNPYKADTVGASEVLKSVSATPLKEDINGKLKNYAAKDISISEDGKKIKVRLINGLVYQDGKKIKASDYKLGMEVFGNPKTKSTYGSWITEFVKGGKELGEGKVTTLSGVKADDAKNSYTIELSKPISYFKSLLARISFAPVSKNKLDELGGVANYGNKWDKIYGSGEYKIVDSKTDNYVTVEKNDKSPLASKSAPKTIKYMSFKDSISAIRQFKSGKLNSVAKSKESDKILGKKEEDKADFKNKTDVVAYFVKSKRMNKDLFKYAMQSIDFDLMNKTYLKGRSETFKKIIPESFDAFKSVASYNVEKRSKEDIKKDVQKVYNGEELQFLLPSETNAAYADFAKFLIGQWKEAGINVNLVTKPFNSAINDIAAPASKERTYDIAYSLWSPDYPEASTFYASLFSSIAEKPYADWISEEYNKEIKSAMEKMDVNEANNKYKKADQILKDSGFVQPTSINLSKYYVKDNGYNTRNHNGSVTNPSNWTKK